MGGNTGNIRTLRNQSGTNGQRTLGSILASDAGNGAGSIARMAKWYSYRGPVNGTPGFFNKVIGLKKGSFSNFSNYGRTNYDFTGTGRIFYDGRKGTTMGMPTLCGNGNVCPNPVG
jgi:hypothetical protein